MKLRRVHHIAIIATDYERSKDFYTRVLGFEFLEEFYREERESWMGKLALDGSYIVELFSFPTPAVRPGWPEATGLRHLAFEVDDVEGTLAELDAEASELTVVESGFEKLPGGTRYRRDRLEQNREGWDVELDELAILLEGE